MRSLWDDRSDQIETWYFFKLLLTYMVTLGLVFSPSVIKTRWNMFHENWLGIPKMGAPLVQESDFLVLIRPVQGSCNISMSFDMM